jgi:hypothetical protein
MIDSKFARILYHKPSKMFVNEDDFLSERMSQARVFNLAPYNVPEEWWRELLEEYDDDIKEGLEFWDVEVSIKTVQKEIKR